MSSSVVQTNRPVFTSGQTSTAEQSTPCASSRAWYSPKSAPTAPTRSGERPSTPSAKAMLPATPPGRITMSSTRKLSESRSSWSRTSWSANRPGKCMSWSVAMDPVTAIGTGSHPTDATDPGRGSGRGPWEPRISEPGSVERVAAGAGAARVRVVDGEALLLDAVDEVDDRALQVRGRHPVDADLQPAEVAEQVAVELAVVEEQLVAQAGAATGLDGDAQVHVVAALLVEQRLGLERRGGGELDAVRLGLDGGGVVDSHDSPQQRAARSCSQPTSGPRTRSRTGGTVTRATIGIEVAPLSPCSIAERRARQER